MKSLFARIFISFWLAMALVVCTVGAYSILFDNQIRIVSNDPLAPIIESLAILSARELETNGSESLQTIFRQGCIDSDATLQVSTASYPLVTSSDNVGSETPELFQRARESGGSVFDFRSNKFRVVRNVPIQDGEDIALLFDSQDTLFQALVRPWQIVIRLGMMLVITGFACYALARTLTSPLRRLSTAANELAAGNLSARIGLPPSEKGDEIATLSNNFDRMAEQLEELVVSQQRLLQDVSHELRSPISRVGVAIELARQQPESLENVLDRMEVEVGKLNELIGELLTLNAVSTGPQQKTELFELESLIETVVEDAKFEARSINKSVEITETTPCQLSGDLRLLYRAIENILRNAVMHTSPGTNVEVSVLHQDGTAQIEISDHGPGVPDEELSQLVEPFFTGKQNRKKGTGLGLAIADRVIRRCGGSLSFRNLPEAGLCATIKLPIRELEMESAE